MEQELEGCTEHEAINFTFIFSSTQSRQQDYSNNTVYIWSNLNPSMISKGEMSKPPRMLETTTQMLLPPCRKEDKEGFFCLWWAQMGVCTMLPLCFQHHTWYVPITAERDSDILSLNVPPQEAMAMAVNSFHTPIASDDTPVQDLVLKLGIKSLSGQITWSLLRPEQWTDIVCDGDGIWLVGSGMDISDFHGPSPIITLKRFLAYDRDSRSKVYKYVTMLLPSTCEVSYS